MRTFILAALAILPAAAAFAQTAPNGVFTPAPVPRVGPSNVTPADRAGRVDGSERGTPFSGLPNTLNAGGGQSSPTTLGDTSRGDTAPSPALGK